MKVQTVKAKILSMALAAAMALSLTPAAAFAAEGGTPLGSTTVPGATAVEFKSLTANGEEDTTATTELTLTFDKDVANLAAADITVTGATRGTLTKENDTGVYKLEISNITVNEGENITVTLNKNGYTFTPESRTVAVHKAAVPTGVCAIGSTGYPTLADAITAAADSGDTIKILENIDLGSEGVTITDKSVTLDLNGKTLTSSTNTITLEGAGLSFEVKGTNGGTLSTSSNNSAIVNSSDPSTITISGGTVTSSSNSTTIDSSAAGTVIVSGGTVSSSGGTAIMGSANITVSGGTVSTTAQGAKAISASSSTITISGGTVSSSSGCAIFSPYSQKITISGNATITSANSTPTSGTIYMGEAPSPAAIVLDIQGGTVSNTANPAGYSVYFAAATITAGNLSQYYTKAASATVGRVYPEAATGITITINGTEYKGSTLQDAITKSGVGATAVTELNITAGEVTEADWNYLKELTAMTSFEIAGTIGDDKVANIPNGISDDTGFVPIFPKSIVTVTVPQKITIGESVFIACAALTTANFSAATSIGEYAFFTCGSLTNASFPAATSIGKYAFFKCGSLTTASFPAATSIGNSAFQECFSLTNASFPVATSIGGYAFNVCNSLTNASFPEVKTIGERAFFGCSALATASFPVATSIDKYAFYDCSALATLKLGATVPTTVGANAFTNCPATRALGYVDASGTALTGDALAAAIANYKAKADTNGKWYGWAVETVTPPTPPSSNGSSSSGSSGDGGFTSAPSTPSGIINTAEGNKSATNVSSAIKNALATGSGVKVSASASFRNYSYLSLDGLKTINSIAAKEAKGKAVNFKINLDKVEKGAVVSRISVDPAALAAELSAKKIPGNLPLGVSFDQKSTKVSLVNARLNKHFSNKVVSVVYDQKSPLNVNADFCAKLNLKSAFGQDGELYFYSYDNVKNTFTRIAEPNYRVDKNGYAYISAPFGGSIVISDEPLSKK